MGAGSLTELRRPWEASVTVAARHEGWGILWEAMDALHRPQYLVLSPTARMLGSKTQGAETGMTLSTIFPSGPLAKCSLPIPSALSSAGPGLLVPKKEILSSGDTMIPLNWKPKLPPSHLELLVLPNQQAKKEVTVPAKANEPDYEGETELLLYTGCKEE